jgi:hypothetical protein
MIIMVKGKVMDTIELADGYDGDDIMFSVNKEFGGEKPIYSMEIYADGDEIYSNLLKTPITPNDIDVVVKDE